MKKNWIGISLMVCVASIALGQVATPQNQITQTDWCTIEVPASAEVGDRVPVKIVLKEIPAGMRLAADFHGRDSSGKYMGMVKWGGAPRAVESGQVVELKIKVIEKPGLGSVHLSCYLSPTGEFKDRVNEAKSQNIQLGAQSE
jgi:hypothetical protein